MSEDAGPRVEVTKDGPYRLIGGARIVRAEHVETDHGEPVDWSMGEQTDPGEDVRLCRCGGSSNKPFCDGTHTVNGFDGTETADRERIRHRQRVYPGEGIVMRDDRSICEHAGFCTDRITNAWRMTRETDNPEVRSRLIEMIERCPSGALSYTLPPSENEVEQTLPVEVGIVADGPLWLRGGIPVRAADGFGYEVRNRMTLCRCGQSRNKPFCDGSHEEAGFTDG